MPTHKYVEKNGSAIMLATKRLASVAPEVKFKEPVTCTSLASTNKAAHAGFETQRRCHQKSKTVVSVAPQKELCPLKIIFTHKQ